MDIVKEKLSKRTIQFITLLFKLILIVFIYELFITSKRYIDKYIDQTLINIIRAIGWQYVRLVLSYKSLIAQNESQVGFFFSCTDGNVGRKKKATAGRRPPVTRPRPPRPARDLKMPVRKRLQKSSPGILKRPTVSVSGQTSQSASSSKNHLFALSANNTSAQFITDLCNAGVPSSTFTSQQVIASSLATATLKKYCISQSPHPGHTYLPPTIPTRSVHDIPHHNPHTHKPSTSQTPNTHIPPTFAANHTHMTSSYPYTPMPSIPPLATTTRKQSGTSHCAVDLHPHLGNSNMPPSFPTRSRSVQDVAYSVSYPQIPSTPCAHYTNGMPSTYTAHFLHMPSTSSTHYSNKPSTSDEFSNYSDFNMSSSSTPYTQNHSTSVPSIERPSASAFNTQTPSNSIIYPPSPHLQPKWLPPPALTPKSPQAPLLTPKSSSPPPIISKSQ